MKTAVWQLMKQKMHPRIMEHFGRATLSVSASMEMDRSIRLRSRYRFLIHSPVRHSLKRTKTESINLLLSSERYALS